MDEFHPLRYSQTRETVFELVCLRCLTLLPYVLSKALLLAEIVWMRYFASSKSAQHWVIDWVPIIFQAGRRGVSMPHMEYHERVLDWNTGRTIAPVLFTMRVPSCSCSFLRFCRSGPRQTNQGRRCRESLLCHCPRRHLYTASSNTRYNIAIPISTCTQTVFHISPFHSKAKHLVSTGRQIGT